MGRASPLPQRVSSPFTTTGERESIPLPAQPKASVKEEPGVGRKWPGGVAAEAAAEARWSGQERR